MPPHKPRNTATKIAAADFDADLLLCSGPSGSRWTFLDHDTGLPEPIVEFLRELQSTHRELEVQAAAFLADGLLGQCLEIDEVLAQVRGQRSDVLRAHLLKDAPQRCTPPRRDAAAAARGVASALRRQHYAVVDDFLAGGSPLHDLLAAMHARGELQPGEIKAGRQGFRRSDLMRWLPARGEQPEALRVALRSLDALVFGLMHDETLGLGTELQRHELQATNYPKGGKYVRHVDETGASAESIRKLTCILYANPGWQQGDGGELRLHLSAGAVDIEPRDNRLLIFFSDSRCPHEVLESAAARFAVSVWYCTTSLGATINPLR